ncbi:WD repeat-containing protein 93 isoform X3 [Hydra vulgaris]|uniref:WD repeat-containing protein 93 isoform X3 n=1 Tax=Hydra vulgaris TaxID=6087 RepID=A0ABM4DEQ6_HYDVU
MFKKKIYNRYNPPSPSIMSEQDHTLVDDLEFFHDRLPQPFRRIDKILWDIFDSAWKIIEIRNEKLYCTKKVLPNIVYEEELLIKEKIVCIMSANNSLFCGCIDGIIAYKLPSLEKYSKFIVSRPYLQNLYLIDDSYDIISMLVVYETGPVEVVGFLNGFFCCLSETFEGELMSKLVSVELSKDYLSVDWKDEQENHWLSIYILKINDWQSIIASRVEKNDEQFGSLNAILKIKPISIQTTQHNSLSSACKAIESVSFSLGTGVNHYLTANFFKSLMLDEKEENTINLATSATVHFLKGPTKRPFFSSLFQDCDSILVWWKNSNLLLFYDLKKNTLNTETDPVFSLPQGDNILVTSVNAQTDLIAIGLMNKTICIWNRYKGELIRFLSVHHSVSKMMFTLHNQLYYILKNNQIWQINDYKLNPVCVEDRSSEFAEQDFNGSIITGPKSLLAVTWASSEVILHDLMTASIVCRLEFYNKKQSIDNLVAFSRDHIITVTREKSLDKNNSARIFLFHPKDNTILKEYFELSNTSTSLETSSSEKDVNKFLQNIIPYEGSLFFHLNNLIDSQHGRVV